MCWTLRVRRSTGEQAQEIRMVVVILELIIVPSHRNPQRNARTIHEDGRRLPLGLQHHLSQLL